MIEKLFHLKKNNTNARTEVIAGLTTFMTMAYILAVNPTMLSAAGMDSTAVLIATCLASFVGTFSKLSICSGAGNGIECLFCIHSMWQYGVFMESGIDGSIC